MKDKVKSITARKSSARKGPVVAGSLAYGEEGTGLEDMMPGF